MGGASTTLPRMGKRKRAPEHWALRGRTGTADYDYPNASEMCAYKMEMMRSGRKGSIEEATGSECISCSRHMRSTVSCRAGAPDVGWRVVAPGVGQHIMQHKADVRVVSRVLYFCELVHRALGREIQTDAHVVTGGVVSLHIL